MKKSTLFLFLALVTLFSCNDDAEPWVSFRTSISPNPTMDDAKVTVYAKGNNLTSTLQVFDPNGEAIFAESFNEETKEFDISLTDKPQGVYKVVLTCTNGETRVSASSDLTKID